MSNNEKQLPETASCINMAPLELERKIASASSMKMENISFPLNQLLQERAKIAQAILKARNQENYTMLLENFNYITYKIIQLLSL